MEQCWHMYRAPDEANKITKKVVEGKKPEWCHAEHRPPPDLCRLSQWPSCAWKHQLQISSTQLVCLHIEPPMPKIKGLIDGDAGIVSSKKYLVLWRHAQFSKTLSKLLCLSGDIGVRLPGIFAQMKLREHFSAFLFLFNLPKNLSRTQAFPIRVYLARVFEKPLHCVDFLGCI